MTDLPTTAKVTRPALGGGDLDINNHSDYILVGPSVMGGTVQWDKKTVSSPWVDGDITVARRRGNVVDNVAVYVLGTDQADLQTNLSTLISAFTQDRFGMQIIIGSANYAWDCEAADYSVEFDTVHFNSRVLICKFAVPRKPVALGGPI